MSKLLGLRVAIKPRHVYAAPRLDAFAEGLERHGITADASPGDCDLLVVWGVASNRLLIEQQRKQGRDVLVMEHGYLGDRTEFTSCGFNGLNGHADFAVNQMPDDRFNVHKKLLKPWRKKGSGKYAVIMGQVPGDAALAGVDFKSWVHETADWFAINMPDIPTVYRQHPNGRFRIETPELAGELSSCLLRAEMVVTWNSNSGVDAALAGVPTIAIDAGSMARDVAAHDLTISPPRPDRKEWLNNLSYCQWTTAEIARGDTWDHLKRKYQ